VFISEAEHKQRYDVLFDIAEDFNKDLMKWESMTTEGKRIGFVDVIKLDPLQYETQLGDLQFAVEDALCRR